MRTIKLSTKQGVTFDPINHTYTLDKNGARLDGITKLIGERLFPGKYASVPESTLKAAAERGHAIHSICEIFDKYGIDTDSALELQGYKNVCLNLPAHEGSEYLVTDGKRYATCIDKVYRVDGDTFDLADIKTTSNLDMDYLSWQLSVCSYLFRKVNKKAKVCKLWGIWLRGDKAELREVQARTDEEVKSLLYDESFSAPVAPEVPKAFLAEFACIEVEIAMHLELLSKAKREHEELLAGMTELMERHGVKKFKGEHISLTYKEATERNSFSSKRSKEEHPELYASYITASPVCATVKINSV